MGARLGARVGCARPDLRPEPVPVPAPTLGRRPGVAAESVLAVQPCARRWNVFPV